MRGIRHKKVKPCVFRGLNRNTPIYTAEPSKDETTTSTFGMGSGGGGERNGLE